MMFLHKRPITSKSKDINVTLPDFIISSLLLSKTDIVFFFAHNVRYGNSVIFSYRIGLTLESFNISTPVSHSVLIFVLNLSQLIDRLNYIITK